ncbi:hypothetical protein TanjilG_20351 [Lupinus angustifolius]|uniref:BZIP domain-containing protein n=1 Tax=Lupinus angustifolius TaxID=3871 RepID=A0A4P1RWB9_LUPAN|nr:PREDICTED: bZIP transcription factor 11-like [Lupinus angustifolius]OIW19226.1 hypothetical protein TanjilG_20351 [Lupinus angustifolius]
MASSPSGGYSGGSSSLQNSNSGSERDHQQHHVMDQKKRKRMLSNRESARRSRMKKQQHLDDLVAQANQLNKENNQISTRVEITTHLYLKIEAENAIIRAQVAELSNRLQSLNEIINYINSPSCNYLIDEDYEENMFNDCGFMMDLWNTVPVKQPIMASADMFMY